MRPDSEPRPPIAQVAAAWVARRSAGLSPPERAELQRWLVADPRHAAAFAAADPARTELDWPLLAGAVDDVLAGLEERARRRRRRRAALAAAGACVAVFLGVAVLLRPGTTEAPGSPRSTLVVQAPSRHTLADGSVVELKDGARLEPRFTAGVRRVTLLEGTAHFHVAHEARPFVVDAGGVTAQALGTAFSVSREPGRVAVLVASGRVAVAKEGEAAAPVPEARPSPASAAPLAVLAAGNGVSVATGAAPAAAPPVQSLPAQEVEERLAWRIPRLEFSGMPLAEVVAQVNRHNEVQFVIADAAIERFTLSGVLRADKIDALVAMLESDFGIRAERRATTIVLHAGR